MLQRKLSGELPKVMDFFTRLTGFKIAAPKVKLSEEYNDAEWYSSDRTGNTISINPNYYLRNGERISYKALLAHSFFHHVQYSMAGPYNSGKLNKRLPKGMKQAEPEDLLNNLIESGAMFFAVSYITRGLSANERRKKIISLLGSRAYTPPKGKFYSGNRYVLEAYAKNGYSVKKTIKQLLDYEGAYSILIPAITDKVSN